MAIYITSTRTSGMKYKIRKRTEYKKRKRKLKEIHMREGVRGIVGKSSDAGAAI